MVLDSSAKKLSPEFLTADNAGDLDGSFTMTKEMIVFESRHMSLR